MFARLFRKKSVVTESAAPSPAAPGIAPSLAPDWPAQLEAARGDDAALLKLAQSTAPHGVRLAAVQALTGAESLRAVEQTFRGRDKALHRAARHQLDTLTRQQTTHATATRLLQEARQLTQTAAERAIPANHLVELDHAWRTLDESLLEAAQRSEFAELHATLAQQMREHGEQQRAAQRQQQRLAAEQAAQEAAARQAATEAALAQQQLEQERLQASRHAAAQARQHHQQTRAQLDARLSTLEATLNDGQVSDIPAHIAQLRELAATAADFIDTPLQARIHHLEAEFARLKEWQQWSLDQARLSLIEAAEQLAATASNMTSLKQHTQDIEQLRTRWKALGTTSHHSTTRLWKRFDAALTLAWQPVAAQRQQLATAREQNRQARLDLLGALEAQPIPTPETHTPDWRALSLAVEHFQQHWRKLGPLEHTVSKHEQPALQARLAHALATYEAPLHAARQTARQQRQQLIAQMQQLLPHERDIVAQVRALQATWQSSTQTIPLPHKDEQSLWLEFKAATDALFQQRTAARQARDDKLAAQESAQTALLAQMHALTQRTQDPAEILERELATLEQQWRELTRQASPQTRSPNKNETQFRSARQQVQQHLQQLRQQHWQTACHALLAAWQDCELAVCPPERLDALPAQIPAVWREALQARCHAEQRVTDDALLDTTLLRLETLLELDTPADFQAARRELKLQDMKRAIETRSTQSTESHTLEPLLAHALRLSTRQPAQSTRLHTILNALPQHLPLR